MYLCSVRCYYVSEFRRVLSRLLFGLYLNRFTTCCTLTLGHLSAFNRPSLSFLFLPFLQVVQRPGTSCGFSSTVSSITPRNFTNFRPQMSKGASDKSHYDICFACGKTGHWRVNCPNSYFTAPSTYKHLQSLPSKDSGSSGQQ